MRTKTICIMAALTWLIPIGGCSGPDGPKWAGGAMAGDNTAEVRLGGQVGALEVYAAPRFSMDRESEGDIGTGVRAYAIYSAVDANMAAEWFGQYDLPAGSLYGGVFGGTEFQDGEIEGGYLLGARVDIGSTEKYQLDFCTEYQYEWTQLTGDDDRYTVMLGPRLLFK